jgi:hypothetical protein
MCLLLSIMDLRLMQRAIAAIVSQHELPARVVDILSSCLSINGTCRSRSEPTVALPSRKAHFQGVGAHA